MFKLTYILSIISGITGIKTKTWKKPRSKKAMMIVYSLSGKSIRSDGPIKSEQMLNPTNANMNMSLRGTFWHMCGRSKAKDKYVTDCDARMNPTTDSLVPISVI